MTYGVVALLALSPLLPPSLFCVFRLARLPLLKRFSELIRIRKFATARFGSPHSAASVRHRLWFAGQVATCLARAHSVFVSAFNVGAADLGLRAIIVVVEGGGSSVGGGGGDVVRFVGIVERAREARCD